MTLGSESCCHLLFLSCRILEERQEHTLYHKSSKIPVQSCSNELSLCVVMEEYLVLLRLHCQLFTDRPRRSFCKEFSNNFKQSCWHCKLFACVRGKKDIRCCKTKGKSWRRPRCTVSSAVGRKLNWSQALGVRQIEIFLFLFHGGFSLNELMQLVQ